MIRTTYPKESRAMRALGIIFSLALCSTSADASMLDNIKKKDSVTCSTNYDAYGFSSNNRDTNQFEGMAVDICKAVAKAVLGDSRKAEVYPTQARDRIPFTASGQYDLLVSTVEWTAYRESFLGIKFTNAWFYDNQQIAVRKNLNIKKPADLDNITLCMVQGNNAEIALGDFSRDHKIKINVITFVDSMTAISTFDRDRCDGYTTDSYALAQQVSKAMKDIDSIEIVDFNFNHKVFGIVVKRNEDEWATNVSWIVNTLIWAEELGITKANVEELAQSSTKAEVRRVLNIEGGFGKKLGLYDRWAIDMIKEFGNYGELFEKHFGSNAKVKFPPRTANKLCRDGGKLCPVSIF